MWYRDTQGRCLEKLEKPEETARPFPSKSTLENGKTLKRNLKGKTTAQGEISIPKTKALYMPKTLNKILTTLLRQRVQIPGRLPRASPRDHSALGPSGTERALLGSPNAPADPSWPRSSRAQREGAQSRLEGSWGVLRSILWVLRGTG